MKRTSVSNSPSLSPRSFSSVSGQLSRPELTEKQKKAAEMITSYHCSYKYTKDSCDMGVTAGIIDEVILFEQKGFDCELTLEKQRDETLKTLDKENNEDILSLLNPYLPFDLYEKRMHRAIMADRVETPLTKAPDLDFPSKKIKEIEELGYKAALVGFYREKFINDDNIRKMMVKDLIRMRDDDPYLAMDLRPCVVQVYPKTTAELDELRKGGKARIHDFIDPNVNLSEHTLWIPTEFDARNGKAISGIVNLDSHMYPSLHRGIEHLMSLMIPMVSDILRMPLHKSHSKVKCIVKAMDYVLPPKTRYEGNLHREGIGEGIVAVGIYYPYTSESMKTPGLTLTALGHAFNQATCVIPCRQGSIALFSNEVYHQLVELSNSSEEHTGDRMIMAFFFIHPLCGPKQVPSNLNILTNIRTFTLRSLRVWMRETIENSDKLDIAWMHLIIADMVAGDRLYRYAARSQFRDVRGVPFRMPGPFELSSTMYEGTFGSETDSSYLMDIPVSVDLTEELEALESIEIPVDMMNVFITQDSDGE